MCAQYFFSLLTHLNIYIKRPQSLKYVFLLFDMIVEKFQVRPQDSRLLSIYAKNYPSDENFYLVNFIFLIKIIYFTAKAKCVVFVKGLRTKSFIKCAPEIGTKISNRLSLLSYRKISFSLFEGVNFFFYLLKIMQ